MTIKQEIIIKIFQALMTSFDKASDDEYTDLSRNELWELAIKFADSICKDSDDK